MNDDCTTRVLNSSHNLLNAYNVYENNATENRLHKSNDFISMWIVERGDSQPRGLVIMFGLKPYLHISDIKGCVMW